VLPKVGAAELAKRDAREGVVAVLEAGLTPLPVNWLLGARSQRHPRLILAVSWANEKLTGACDLTLTKSARNWEDSHTLPLRPWNLLFRNVYLIVVSCV